MPSNVTYARSPTPRTPPIKMPTVARTKLVIFSNLDRCESGLGCERRWAIQFGYLICNSSAIGPPVPNSPRSFQFCVSDPRSSDQECLRFKGERGPRRWGPTEPSSKSTFLPLEHRQLDGGEDVQMGSASATICHTSRGLSPCRGQHPASRSARFSQYWLRLFAAWIGVLGVQRKAHAKI